MALEQYTTGPVPSKEGKAFIQTHHYSHGCHNGPMTYGLFNGTLVGVLAFATPCSENVRASVYGPDRKNEVTELHRLVILDGTPKNSESFLIARALRWLKQTKPNITAVLSFADQTEGHLGTIYQATNAIYLGTTGKTTFYRDQTGRLRHPRQNGKNISRAEAKALGWIPEQREGKHKYLFLLPNSKPHKRLLEASIKQTPQPYPKPTPPHSPIHAA